MILGDGFQPICVPDLTPVVIAVGTVPESSFFFTPTGIFGDYEMINNIEVSVGTGASSDTFQLIFFYRFVEHLGLEL